jgi:hypothetical protein
MSVNSQKQTYEQLTEWLKWLNKKHNRYPKRGLKTSTHKNYNK